METFLLNAGYLALILFAFVEACSIPISSEITFGFAGVLAFQGHLNLVLVIVIGALAELAGSTVSYVIGRKGGRRTVERLGRYVLITRSDLDRVEGFFAGRGSWTVAVGRALPLVRTFVGLVAGFVEVPPAPFAIFNVIGTVIWATALTLIGYALGSAWHTVSHAVSVGGYVIAALIVLGLAAIIAHRVREVRRERAGGGPGPDSPAAGSPAAGSPAADRPAAAARARHARRGGGPV